MPTYFLHLRERGELFQDFEGAEFADVDAARDEARNAIRDIVAGHITAGERLNIQAVEICDDKGNHVATVTVAEAVSATFPISQDTFEVDLTHYLDSDAARCSELPKR